jgi:hypothetical protein
MCNTLLIDVPLMHSVLLRCPSIFSLGKVGAQGLINIHGAGTTTALYGLGRQGGAMELRMRLNVLAAIVSFGFLAAIVLGMV